MRVVLVGPSGRRDGLRAALPEGVEVWAEAPTLAAAREFAPHVDAYLLAASTVLIDPPLAEPLTMREAQALELLADGLPNKQIASRLGLSDETVKFHLSSVFGKLGVSNRTEAVRQAIRRGLVPL